MRYKSTRNANNKFVSLNDALLKGLANDGGLFLPESIPKIEAKTWENIHKNGLSASLNFVWNIFSSKSRTDNYYSEFINKALLAFPKPLALPLRQIAPLHWLLDISLGPTLAFKDIAMQCLGNILPKVITSEAGKQHPKNDKRIILGATSGDTGPSAIHGFKNQPNIHTVILYPLNGVSDFQLHQMTSINQNNIHSIAIKGSFDNCQSLVKQAFQDENNSKWKLLAVNSINWGRIISQIGYFIYSASQLGAPYRKFDVTIPTGNFGNVFSAFIAKKMGVPINNIIIATNKNNILSSLTKHGYANLCPVVSTITPSMDVQIPSNLERYLYYCFNNSSKLIDYISNIGINNKYSSMVRSSLNKDFKSIIIEEETILKTIGKIWQNNNLLIDPHTATSIAGASCQQGIPMLSLMTASYIKFIPTIKKAISDNDSIKHLIADNEKILTLKENNTLSKAQSNSIILDDNYSQLSAYLDKLVKI